MDHWTCGMYHAVGGEEAHRCGRPAVAWRKDGLGEDFRTSLTGFTHINGVCETHAPSYPERYHGILISMTLGEVVVWEVMNS